MAQVKEKYVTLYAPGGTEVEVGEARGEVLKGRGYTTKPPRSVPSLRRPAPNDDEVASLKAALAKAEQERDDAVAAATDPKK